MQQMRERKAKKFGGYAFYATIQQNFLNWNPKAFWRQQQNETINERPFSFQDLRSRKGKEGWTRRYRKQ